jgi:hypothetical protein
MYFIFYVLQYTYAPNYYYYYYYYYYYSPLNLKYATKYH